jgi:signal transduction histidine kinase
MEERLEERTRIARDLHDTLLQSLAGVSLQLSGISKQVEPVSEKAASNIGRVREQVDSAFREARTKVWNLRSPELEVLGLVAFIRQLTERIGAGTTAGCDLAVSGQPRPCKPDVEDAHRPGGGEQRQPACGGEPNPRCAALRRQFADVIDFR